jgi:hypothetical protein
MSPIGRRCVRPDRPRAARRLAGRAPAIARSVAAWSSLALAGVAGAQQNLGFEAFEQGAPAGWTVAGGGEVVGYPAASEGERSLEVTRSEPASRA